MDVGCRFCMVRLCRVLCVGVVVRTLFVLCWGFGVGSVFRETIARVLIVLALCLSLSLYL